MTDQQKIDKLTETLRSTNKSLRTLYEGLMHIEKEFMVVGPTETMRQLTALRIKIIEDVLTEIL